MAIPISDVHDFVRTIIKKNRGGFISPNDIDRAVNRGVSDFISAVITKFKRTGKFEYDHLLVKRASFPVTSTTSVQALPADYVEALTVYVLNDNVLTEGTIYSWDEFLEVKNSKILTPDLSFPIATIYIDSTGNPKIEFAPVPLSGTTYTYTLVYMRKPAKAVYTYTAPNGNITFNPSGPFVDIDLDDRYFTDIVSRALMYIGISLKDSDIASIETLKDGNQRADER